MYNDVTSRVSNNVFDDKSSKSCSFNKKSDVSLMYDGIFLTRGFRWLSTNLDMAECLRSQEETKALLGLSGDASVLA